MDIAAESVDTFPSCFPALKKNQGTCFFLLGPKCLQPCRWGVTQAKGTKIAPLALRLQVEGLNLRAAVKRLSWDCRPGQGVQLRQSAAGWEIILPHLILAKAHT